MELTKKRLKQDHEEEMENMAAAKKAIERRVGIRLQQAAFVTFWN